VRYIYLGHWPHLFHNREQYRSHRVKGGSAYIGQDFDGCEHALGAWGGDIDNFLSILLLRQEPLVQGAVPAQG